MKENTRTMKLIIWRATAVAVVGVVAALVAAPAGAQENLGFEADSTEGSPGDVVTGRVDVDDVAAHCNASPEELQDRFAATHAVLDDLEETYFPSGLDPADINVTSFEQISWLVTRTVASQISTDIDLADQAFPQTFIMTFAEIATQDPVGEMGSFDRETGEGSVTVPDLNPGPWGVAGTCVSPSTDASALQDAIAVNAELVEDFLTSEAFEEAVGEPFPGLPVTDGIFLVWGIGVGTAQEIGDDLVPAMMEPDALGAEIFCVLDADGECPDDGNGNGNGNGSGNGNGNGDAPTPPAQPVTGTPSLTG